MTEWLSERLAELVRLAERLARDARPTLRDLSRLVRSPGASNDLIELTKSSVPLRDAAVGPTKRNGKERDGAFPGSARALKDAAPELATARPYAPDLTGWFDDFSHSGLYDALGGASRAGLYVNLFAPVNGVLKQTADTKDLIYDIGRLIEFASSFYTLYPGDVYYTGTPQGVSAVKPGDVLRGKCDQVGEFEIAVRAHQA